MEDADNGGIYTCVGAGIYGKPQDLSLNFVVNIKLLLKKIKSFLKVNEYIIK